MSMQNATWGPPSTSTTSGLGLSESRNGLLSRRAESTGGLHSQNDIRSRAVRLGLREEEEVPRRACARAERRIKSCLSIGKEMENLNISKKNVSFHNKIEIREHPRTLGDHPSVSRGPPLALDWYDEKLGNTFVVELDHYEKSRSLQRRSKADLFISDSARATILKEEVGVTTRQLVIAMEEATKVKRMRRETNAGAHLEQRQVFLESAGRKLQRLVRKRASTKREMEELWERAAAAAEDGQPESIQSLPIRRASMPSMTATRRNSLDSSRPQALQLSKSSLRF